MGGFEKQGGVAFLVIFYTHRNEIYYLPYRDMRRFWDRAAQGGRKSFRYEELDRTFLIRQNHGVLVPYLDTLQKDLDRRD